MSDGFADLGNGRLWYERTGGEFPVVFMHSGLMDARNLGAAVRGRRGAAWSSSPRVSGYPWRDPGADALAEQVARSIAAGDPQGAIELQLAVWAPVTSKADPGVRTVALANAAAQIDPSWREEPPAAADRLDELRAAALLIVGEEDIAEIGEIADLVAAQVPGASKRVVVETDQLVNVGKPERFNRLALDFLAFAG